MKRILVTGSRHWTDARAIHQALGYWQQAWRDEGIVVVHGDATGADRLARQSCATLGIPEEAHPADWHLHGRRAGVIRNQEMVDAGADQVLVFRSPGKSRGTDDCMVRALTAGLPVEIIHEEAACD